MDFRLSDDQRALRSGARQLLAALFPRERLRAMVDAGGPGGAGSPGGASVRGASVRELWRELGDAGFFSLRLPEQRGGTGLGLPETVLVFEEAGRALLPGPLVATHLAAGLVEGAAEGRALVTALDRSGPVEHLASADAVLLLDRATLRILRPDPDPDADTAVLPRALGARPVQAVDPTTPLHLVSQLPDDAGAIPAGPPEVARLRGEATLLTAALQLGSALRTMEMAVAHVKARSQFGRPVGAFQAVQHLCARMFVRAEIARCSVYAASLTVTFGDVSQAKLLADTAAVRNARDCLQLHGGFGFTWDADVHPHLKRAWVRAAQWQSAAEAEEGLAEELLTEFPGGPATGQGEVAANVEISSE
ncbi:acyl-CoA dehydrogenase family protein [Streptomyces syringium]|uniref:acyl-CoA dehydrogenase family protein n=1 Tax=Streptomyces syringium TaxID=76729 RepID=UPI0037CF4FCA